MGCVEAERLLDVYTQSLAAFHDSQAPLLAGMLRSDPAYIEVRIAKERAFAQVARARGAYWKHVQMHGCRATASPRTRRKETFARLRSELLDARLAFDEATKKFNTVLGISEDADVTPDGTLAIRQAKSLHTQVSRNYADALSRFVDFVNNGTVPEELK
jgi:hypothetical protein